MNYKVERALKKNRKTFIICAILWVFLTIVFIMPLSYSIFAAKFKGNFNLEEFFTRLGMSIKSPFSAFGSLVKAGGFGQFLSTEIGFSIIYLILVTIGVIRSAPKHEYTDIEHGSSDWSRNGEQYQILNKNKGIILAENNYLPVDKRGNVNVLVVGRFRFW